MNSEQIIARLMNEHGNSILRLCALYLGDSALAEDAAQETFLRAFKSLNRFRGESTPKTWLTRIAINVCKDMSRKRRRQPLLLEIMPDSPESEAQYDDSVLNEVMALPEKYRALVLLRYYQEMSVADAAKALGISQNAAATRLMRAREMLRLRIETWYFDD